MNPRSLFLLLFATQSILLQAQFEYAYDTFYETRIVNGQSIEMTNPGTLKFHISHRFGPVNGGAYELWGLDASTIRLGFDYGINNWLMVGIGRSSFEKTFDGYYKIRLLRQGGEKSTPVTLSFYNSVALRSQDWPNENQIDYVFAHRMSYTFQLLIARKFNDRFSMQIMPSHVHRNFVPTNDEKNDVLALGMAGRIRITKNITSSLEYYYVPGSMLADGFHRSLAIGFDINTKGHVFGLHFGNATGMIEKFFITETTGSWADGDVRFGFNISRDFKLRGRKF